MSNELIAACSNKMEQHAVQIIKSTPNIVGNMDCSNTTALMYACLNRLTSVAEELIDLGEISNINCVNIYGKTALIYACENGMERIAIELIRTNKALPNHTHKNFNALLVSMEYGLINVFTELLNLPNINVNTIFENGNNVLITACAYKCINYIMLLLSHPSIDLTHSNGTITPLLWACGQNNSKIASLILNHDNIHPHYQDKYGNTALHYACINNMVNEVDILMNKFKCSPNLRNKHGDLLLHTVCRSIKYKKIIMKLLMQPGVNLQLLDEDGNNVLMMLCNIKYTAGINYIINHFTVNINHLNILMESALLLVVKNSIKSIGMELLKKYTDVDVNVVDINNMSILMYACENNLECIILKLLNFHNINYNYKNNGLTALDIAIYHSNRNTKIIHALLQFPDIEFSKNTLLDFCKEDNKLYNDIIFNMIDRQPQYLSHSKISSALIYSCKAFNSELAIKIIETGHSNPSMVDIHKKHTALLLACKNHLFDVVYKLLELLDSDIDINIQYINIYNETAFSLLNECKYMNWEEHTHLKDKIFLKFEQYHTQLLNKYIIKDFSGDEIKMNNNTSSNGTPIGVILMEPLKENDTIILSDGYGYSRYELYNLYQHETYTSPITRQPFTDEEMYIINILYDMLYELS